jgi:hypothetical protein
MHTIVISGTLGPIYRAVLRLSVEWHGHPDFDGVPHLFQMMLTRSGLQVTTTSRPMRDFLVSRLVSGLSAGGGVDPTADVWGPPSSEWPSTRSPSGMSVVAA